MATWGEHRSEIERRRQHTDDGMWLVVQREGGSDDRGISREAALPKTVAEQDGLWSVPRAFLRIERPSEQRPHAEHVEEIVGNGNAAEALRLTLAAQEVVADAVEREVPRDRRERLRPLAQVEHVSHLRRLAGQTAGVAVGDPYELLRVGERQRPQNQRVDYAEDGSGGADAEPDDEEGKGSEAGVAAKRPKRVAQILTKIFESHGAAFDGQLTRFRLLFGRFGLASKPREPLPIPRPFS